jgi:hypothetical protein
MTAHSADPPRARPAVDAASVAVASAAIVLSVIGLAYRPGLLTPAAAALALAAAGMSVRWRAFAAAAVAIAGLAWLVGMTIAVLAETRVI